SSTGGRKPPPTTLQSQRKHWQNARFERESTETPQKTPGHTHRSREFQRVPKSAYVFEIPEIVASHAFQNGGNKWCRIRGYASEYDGRFGADHHRAENDGGVGVETGSEVVARGE